MFSQQKKDVEKATQASYLVILNIAKAKKPHKIGEELITPCSVQMAAIMCRDQVADKVKTFPLSDGTVKRRIDDMAKP